MSSCCGQNEPASTLAEQFHCPDAQPLFPYSGRYHRHPVTGSPALQVDNLVVHFPGADRPAVDGVCLQVLSGQRVALVGHNGAGKSTLLRAVAGLVPAQSGSILVYGNAVGACHHRTAFLPQRAEIDWHFPITAAELVMTGRFVHLGWFRRPRREDSQVVAQALEHLGIAHLAGRQISQLSGGQQQRVLIARAMVQEASLFLLDEPMNGVDEATREIVEQVISEHARRGGSVVVATHDLSRLSDAFEVAVYMRDGRIEQIVGKPESSLQAVH